MRRKLEEIVKDVYDLVECINSVTPGPATEALQLNVAYLINHPDIPIDFGAMPDIMKRIHELAENIDDVTPSPAATRLRFRTRELMNYPACDLWGGEGAHCTLREGYLGMCHDLETNVRFVGRKTL